MSRVLVAKRLAKHPLASPRRAASIIENRWITIDGRMLFMAGYTSGGAPYGTFADDMQPHDDHP